MKSNGLQYENRIFKTLKAVQDMPFKVAKPKGGFSAADPDLVLKFGRKLLPIEIKYDSRAQMGGGSYNYDMAKKKFQLAGANNDGEDHDPVIEKKILETLNNKKMDLDRVLDFAKKSTPVVLSQNITGFPLRTTKSIWQQMVTKGYLRNINTSVEVPIKFMINHYNKKNCFYIQIGGMGLYYMGKNPLDLPIPELTAKMVVEMRIAQNGASLNKTLNELVSSGSLRVQGRLDKSSLRPSPYSLERTDDYVKLFGGVTEEHIKALP